MKRNTFGEAQAEPHDDLELVFLDEHGCSDDLTAERETFEECDWLDGWTASVQNADGDMITVRGFESCEALEAYLEKYDVEILR